MSASQHKREYPPLLPKGFHPLDIDGMRKICVEAFPENARRVEIMSGFELIYESLQSAEIPGEIWIDGSFLTKKVDPDDIDFVVMTPNAIFDDGTPEQKSLIDWLIDNEDDPKKSFRCHSHVELMYDQESPLHYLTFATRNHWSETVFGYSCWSKFMHSWSWS